jgi:hypothetical protein
MKIVKMLPLNNACSIAPRREEKILVKDDKTMLGYVWVKALHRDIQSFHRRLLSQIRRELSW